MISHEPRCGLRPGEAEAAERRRRGVAANKANPRPCARCGHKLGAHNPGPFCSPCARSLVEDDHAVVLPEPDPAAMPEWLLKPEEKEGRGSGVRRGSRKLPGLGAAVARSGLPKAEVARRVGVRYWKMDAYAGQACRADPETVEALARVLGVEPGDLTTPTGGEAWR